MTNTDKITDFAIQKINSAIDAVSHTLPKATEYLLQVTSLNCLFSTIYFFVFLLTFFSFLYLAIKFFLQSSRESALYNVERYNINNNKLPDGDMSFGIGMIFTLLSGVSLVASIFYLDIWSLVGIWHPDLYLVHIAVNKVIG